MYRTKPTRSSGIYQIRSKLNGKIYIGSAINIKNRWNGHLLAFKRNRNSRYLQNHVNKYGIDDLQFSIIEFCAKKDLIEREQYYIDTMHPEFNLSPTAGNSLGVKFSEKTKKKISISQKGKVITLEQRERISQTLKGNIPWNKGKKTGMVSWNKNKKLPPSWNKGMKMSEEYRQKLSITHKGQIHTEEQKRKVSESIKNTICERGGHWNLGFHHTEETKRRIANFQKGRKRSEETKRRISESKCKNKVA